MSISVHSSHSAMPITTNGYESPITTNGKRETQRIRQASLVSSLPMVRALLASFSPMVTHSTEVPSQQAAAISQNHSLDSQPEAGRPQRHLTKTPTLSRTASGAMVLNTITQGSCIISGKELAGRALDT